MKRIDRLSFSVLSIVLAVSTTAAAFAQSKEAKSGSAAAQLQGTWRIDVDTSLEVCIALEGSDCVGWKALSPEEIAQKRATLVAQGKRVNLLEGELVFATDTVEFRNFLGKSATMPYTAYSSRGITLLSTKAKEDKTPQVIPIQFHSPNAFCFVPVSHGSDIFCLKRMP